MRVMYGIAYISNMHMRNRVSRIMYSNSNREDIVKKCLDFEYLKGIPCWVIQLGKE
jgi:hypothetical protein